MSSENRSRIRPWKPSDSGLAGAADAMAGVVAEDAAGRQIGRLVVERVPMRVADSPCIFARIVDLHVEAEYRLGGVHGLRSDLFLSLDSCLKEGGEPQLLGGALTEQEWWTFKRLLGFEAIGTSIPLLRADAWALAAPAAVEAVVLEGGSNPPDLEVGPHAACARVRDARFFREATRPRGRSAVLAMRGDSAVGSAVYEARKGRTALIDWCAAPGDWECVMALLSPHAGSGAPPLETAVTNPGHWTLHALQEAGFRFDAGRRETFLAARVAAAPLTRQFLAESWEEWPLFAGTGTGDSSVCDEEIVTPPPPGDR